MEDSDVPSQYSVFEEAGKVKHSFDKHKINKFEKL